jgi:hypothetical protein
MEVFIFGRFLAFYYEIAVTVAIPYLTLFLYVMFHEIV